MTDDKVKDSVREALGDWTSVEGLVQVARIRSHSELKNCTYPSRDAAESMRDLVRDLANVVDALQAERDKLSAELSAAHEAWLLSSEAQGGEIRRLSAEVERLTAECALGDMRASYDDLMAQHRSSLVEVASLQAKLTALVEASEDVSGLVHEERSGALHVAKGNGPAFSAAIRRLRQALAHHSATSDARP